MRWEFATPDPQDDIIRQELFGTGEHSGSDPKNLNLSGHACQISDLAEAILTGKQLVLDGNEGRRAVELICGIYESARTGKPFFFNR